MDEELSPQQAERVRRLLAEARHTGPMPDDVAARLDRVIADLAGDPASRPAPAGAPVVRLDERRRRAGRLLLAAAVVVVGGVAVGQVVDGGSEGGDASMPASGQAEDQGRRAPDRDGVVEGQASDEAGDAEMPGAVSETRRSISQRPPVALRGDTFATAARDLAPGARGQRNLSSSPSLESGATASDRSSCPAGAWGGGRYVRVVVDRDPGWLVYRAPRGDTQVVDLFLCGEDSPARSATLPLG